MSDVMDRPPTITTPPELPPYLRGKGGPKRRIILLPSLMLFHVPRILQEPEKNWKTVVYDFMLKVDLDSEEMQLAHTSTRRYRQWLDLYTEPDAVPPHIVFGGAIEAVAEPDPTFHTRWTAYAKETFV